MIAATQFTARPKESFPINPFRWFLTPLNAVLAATLPAKSAGSHTCAVIATAVTVAIENTPSASPCA